MIIDSNYVPMEGDSIKMYYDSHNEDTNIGTDSRLVQVTKSCYYNPKFSKGLIFNALCENEIKNFYKKRIMFAVVNRHNNYIIYANDKYDEDLNYIGDEADR